MIAETIDSKLQKNKALRWGSYILITLAVLACFVILFLFFKIIFRTSVGLAAAFRGSASASASTSATTAAPTRRFFGMPLIDAPLHTAEEYGGSSNFNNSTNYGSNEPLIPPASTSSGVYYYRPDTY
jgi:hypothetical protein